MKSAEAKPATVSKSGPGKPFFSGKGEGVGEGERRPAFFSTGATGPNGIQTKLTVGAPGDKYERQAEATADKVVMRMAETKAPEKRARVKPMTPAMDGNTVKSQAPPVQMKCAQCEMKERKMKKEEEETPQHHKVQRKPIFDSNAEPPPADNKPNIQRCAACDGKDRVQRSGESGGGETPASPDLESRLNSTKGGGQPLPDGTRQQMESSMGADFSGVRVHNDSGAAQMNKDLSAHAFTHGKDIYFNSGKYDPQHKDGQHLLAHELTHVVQQGGAEIKTAPAATGPQAPVQQAPAPQAAAAQAPAPGGQPNSLQTAAPNVKPGPSPAPATVAPDAKPGAPGAAGAPTTAVPTKAPAAATSTTKAPAAAASTTKAAPKVDDGVDAQLARLTKAHKSEYKTTAVAQAANLEKNTMLSRLAVNQTARARTLEIRQWFADKKNSINRFFVGTGQDVLNTIQQKQLQFMQMSLAVMNKVQSVVSNTEQGLLDLGDRVHHQLSAFVDTISSGVTDAVNAVAGKITGFINSIHIADIPGAATIRNAIVSAVNWASGKVRGVISSITQALQIALTKITQIVTAVIRTVGQLIQQLLSSILEVIMRIQQMLFMAVRRIGNTILSKMTGFLNGTIFQVLQQGEDYLVEQVEEARLIRLMQLDDNQAQVLKAMADVIDPKKKPEQKDAAKTSREQRLLYFSQVEQIGVKRNAGIVAKFVAETSSFFRIAIHKIVAFGEYIDAVWQSATRQYKENLTEMWNTVVQKVSDFISEEIGKIKAFFSKLVKDTLAIGSKFMVLVSGVKKAVVKLVSSAADHFGSSTLAFVAGGGGALSSLPVPQLAPQPQFEPEFEQELEEFVTELEELEEPAAEALELAEEEMALAEEAAVVAEEAETATEAVAEGWEVVLIVVVVVVVLVILALAGYLLYLLVEELLKPKPDPQPIPIPEPQPVPEPDPEEPEQCEPDEIPDPTAPSGLLGGDPIRVIWFKPLSLYEDPLIIGGKKYHMNTQHQPLPPPFQNDSIGVNPEFIPAAGKPLNMFKIRNRNVQEKFFRRLRSAGFSWRGKGGNRLSPDHVLDLFWNGPDEFDNLWPLDSVYNRNVGPVQNQKQILYFRPDPRKPCAVFLSIEDAIAKFGKRNMQSRAYIIIDVRPM